MEAANRAAISRRQPGVSSLLYLRLFGGLVLEEDGAALTGRAAQKRRLALLALLATAPGRSLNRNRITGLLWPEKDEDQARHLLSVAAYEIRKELGEDVILTRGEDLVLDPLVVGADVADFEDALTRDDYDEAVALYRGPFLEGFFLGGSSEFEHWIDAERARYERQYRTALTARAEALEDAGDPVAAADAWRKAANADRFDSRVALRLLRALDAAGNRTGALQFARIHEALLMEEFGTAPDPAFAAAVQEIRDGATTAAPQRPAPASGARAAAAGTAAAGPAGAAGAAGRDPAAPGSPGGPPPAGSSTAVLDPPAPPRAVPAASPPPRGGWRRGALAAVFTAVALVLGYIVATGLDATGLRVVVLPLEAPDPEDQPFADGLTESITDALGQVEGVNVLASSAAFAMRGVSAAEAMRRSSADYVVEGSVRRDPGGDSVRVRVALTAPGGDAPWSETYDRPIAAYRRTWDDIARAVLGEMQVELGGGSFADPAGDTDDPLAREMYQRGRSAWLKRTPEGLRTALSYYRQATSRDPDYAQAHAGLAEVYALMGAYDYGILPPDSAFPLARREARRALELAPRLPEAHAVLASIRFGYDRDWQGAEEAYRRAIELKPHYAEAHHWYSLFLLARGRHEEAAEEVRRAIELDSLSPVFHASLARQNYFRGDAAASVEGYQRALRIEPAFVTALVGGGVALLELGRHDEAIRYFERGAELVGGVHPLSMALTANAHARAGRPARARDILARLEEMRAAGHWIPPEWIALVHIGLGDEDAAIDAFQRALDNRSTAVPFYGIEPLARPLWDNPRFQALIARGQRPATPG